MGPTRPVILSMLRFTGRCIGLAYHTGNTAQEHGVLGYMDLEQVCQSVDGQKCSYNEFMIDVYLLISIPEAGFASLVPTQKLKQVKGEKRPRTCTLHIIMRLKPRPQPSAPNALHHHRSVLLIQKPLWQLPAP
jgi:hypothetical protein